MKPNDLRIGNYIIVDNDLRELDRNKIFKVVGVYKEIDDIVKVEDISFEENNFGQFIEFIKPILLTTEILVKLGFENWGDVTVNEYEKFERWVLHNVIDGTSNFEVHIIYSNYGKTNHKEICFSIDDDERLYVYQTDFLHNLQNTYFMVTGNEIEYKLQHSEVCCG